MSQDDPNRAFRLLVADSLEALIPLVDEWLETVAMRAPAGRTHAYAQGYRAGARAMGAEVKDQLVDRILRLRQ